jgi:hypothetical protein
MKVATYIFRNRWAASTVSLFSFAVCSWVLFLTVTRIAFEYFIYPRWKAADGYSYPQFRYTLFDSVLILWCFSGVLMATLLFWSVIIRKTPNTWTYRFAYAFAGLFVVLVGGVVLGMTLRSAGY